MAENCETCGAPEGLLEELQAHRAALNALDHDLNAWADQQYWAKGAMDMRDFKRVLAFKIQDARDTVARVYGTSSEK